MSKLRRTVLSGVVTPIREAASAGSEPSDKAPRRRSATIQQTVYLPPAVHDQLRELGV
jgi:hypothetical protein